VLPLDNLLDTANPSDTEVSELVYEQRADETFSVAFDFAKEEKGGLLIIYVCSRTHIAVSVCEMYCVTVRSGRVEEIIGRASQRHHCYTATCRTSQVSH